MSLNIGQLRRSSISSYTTPVPFTLGDKETISIMSESIRFKDKWMRLKSANYLSINHHFYLNFSVARELNNEQIIKVYLLNSNEQENNIQNIKSFTITRGDPRYSVSFELIFTPNSTYTDIVFELQREVDDFLNKNPDGTYGRIISLKIDNFEEINNIVDTIGVGPLKKIGVQGPPGLMMCINGEEIHIGRSGVYELYFNISVDFLGFVIKKSSQTQDGLDYFILDYQY